MIPALGGLRAFKKSVFPGLLRVFGLFLLALAAFALVLLIFGKNPIKAYIDIFESTLTSGYGLSETLVKMIPLILTALAVAVPSRIWLI
ncbi:MAG: Nucleoside transporter, permease protein 1, partial [Deltaproteobacteria bacterium]|nr:Nucleoside transporter, permease protein 1 [Deltaproteobacteria bacterium]